jgi:MEMO1 family protein
VVRKPAVAGSFYPSDAKQLEETVSGFIGKADLDRRMFSGSCAFVAPHAGYVYSGHVAAYAYAALEEANRNGKIDTIVLVGPNHTGYGDPMALSLEDWQTPLGTLKNDRELAKAIMASSPDMSADETAHAYEHSVEVQLPFIQRILPDVKIVPICMGDQSYAASRMLADAIGRACTATKRKVAVVASSDFNHYDSAEMAREKDLPAIGALKGLDVVKFNALLKESKDTACGYGPITTAALFAASKGAKEGVLLKYSNSGEMTNDYSSVVAYASIAFV